MAKRAKTAKVEPVPGAQGGMDAATVKRTISSIQALKAQMDGPRGEMGAEMKDFEERGGHRAALKLVAKLESWDVTKRMDYLRAFDLYRQYAELDAQGDMFDDAERESNEASMAAAAGATAH